MDFSLDGYYIQAYTEDQQMGYFDLQSKKMCMDSFMDLKNEEWSSWTSPYGWRV
jgi:hypothetical protein